MKRRVKIKLNSLKVVSILDQLFNESRGRGLAKIKHGKDTLVMIPLESYQALQNQMDSLISQIQESSDKVREELELSKNYFDSKSSRSIAQDEEAVAMALARRAARQARD